MLAQFNNSSQSEDKEKFENELSFIYNASLYGYHLDKLNPKNMENALEFLRTYAESYN